MNAIINREGIDKDTLFMLNGDSLKDLSPNNITIDTYNGFSEETHIVDEELNGEAIKCLYFKDAGYIQFTLDPSFFDSDWTIDWWDKDETDMTSSSFNRSAIFTNETEGNHFAFRITAGDAEHVRRVLHMSSSGTHYNMFEALSIRSGTQYGEWVHRAIVYTKEDGKYTVYQNGRQLGHYYRKGMIPYKNPRFQMGKYKNTSSSPLYAKIYRFRVSKTARYFENFEASIEPYDNLLVVPELHDIEPLQETASLEEILDASIKINQNYEALKIRLINYLRKNNVETSYEEFEPYTELLDMLEDMEYVNVDSIRAELIKDINNIIGGL